MLISAEAIDFTGLPISAPVAKGVVCVKVDAESSGPIGNGISIPGTIPDNNGMAISATSTPSQAACLILLLRTRDPASSSAVTAARIETLTDTTIISKTQRSNSSYMIAALVRD